MKRFLPCFMALLLIAAGSPAMAQFPTPVQVDEPIVVVATQETLTVNVNGRGKVESNPDGIDCDNDGSTATVTCTADFATGTAVALMATAPPADDDGSYFFCGWDSGPYDALAAYALVLDSATTVDAGFCALGVPAYLEPPPSSSDMFYYVPVAEPVIYGGIEDWRPIAVVERSDGGFDLNVGLISFGDGSGSGVDIYAAISIDSTGDFYLIDSSGSIVPLSSGLVPWKTNVSGQLIKGESLLEIPGLFTPYLPGGLYHVHLMVTPAGSTSYYYYWVTYFEIMHFLLNPFLVTATP